MSYVVASFVQVAAEDGREVSEYMTRCLCHSLYIAFLCTLCLHILQISGRMVCRALKWRAPSSMGVMKGSLSEPLSGGRWATGLACIGRMQWDLFAYE